MFSKFFFALMLAIAVGMTFAWPGQGDGGAETTVVAGPDDSLFKLALAHGTTVEAIMRANQLTSTDAVLVGRTLRIPVVAGRAGSGDGDGSDDSVAVAAAADLAPVGAGSVTGATDPVTGAANPTTSFSATTAGAVSADGTYTIQPGDTLHRIAARHGTTVEALMRYNGMTSADTIFAGRTLRLAGAAGVGGAGDAPAMDAVAAAADAAAADPPLLPPADAAPYRWGRQIIIDLSDQTVTAYEDGAALRTFIASTGKPSTPTPVGHFAIYSRYASQDMSGPGYWAPGVPYVQYFTGDYALHGTYWHTDYGTPVSHGCVNLQTPDAEWLWRWASIGTGVVVQW